MYGTIIAGSGGTLNFTGGSIDSQGNNFSVLATNPAAVNLYNTSTNYTVEVNGSGGANPQGVDIEGTHIDGSLVTNSAYSVLVVNNSIVEQNAEFFTTTHVPSHFTTSMRNTLCNITIGGTLEVESNTAAFGIGAGNGCAAPPSSGLGPRRRRCYRDGQQCCRAAPHSVERIGDDRHELRQRRLVVFE